MINNTTLNAAVADDASGHGSKNIDGTSDGNGGNGVGRNQQAATSDPSDAVLSAPSEEAWQTAGLNNLLSGSRCKPAVVGAARSKSEMTFKDVILEAVHDDLRNKDSRK